MYAFILFLLLTTDLSSQVSALISLQRWAVAWNCELNKPFVPDRLIFFRVFYPSSRNDSSSLDHNLVFVLNLGLSRILFISITVCLFLIPTPTPEGKLYENKVSSGFVHSCMSSTDRASDRIEAQSYLFSK